MWNNAVHVEAYLAIPSMGAVLHTLNLRLPPEQLAWIVNHADDKVVIADGTLLPLLVPLLPHLPGIEHVVVSGPGDRSALAGVAPRVHEYEELIVGRPTTYDWPELENARPPPCVTPPAPPGRQGRRLLPPLHLPALHAGQHVGVDGRHPHKDTTLV
ncbi:Long-chain-fatty-acid--CoA ligase OS=Streptomyces microflavus OX=1919 GN=Smic_40630 PE=4 SV=1 [Streptomyces microflavus]